MVIIGLDPSLCHFGMVATKFSDGKITELIDAETVTPVIKVEKKQPKNVQDLNRFRMLSAGLTAFIDKHRPDVITAELPVGSQSSRAMVSYAACIAIISTLRVPLIVVTPTEVKMAACNDKFAEKREVIEWAVKAHPSHLWKTIKRKTGTVITNGNEHMADALAGVYAGIKKEQFNHLIIK